MLPAESIQCCITSPPYWGLRNYQVDGQIGLEATPEEWVAKMVAVFGEVRRVLRADGTVWLNLGDGYNANQGSGFNAHAVTRPHLTGEGTGQKRIDEESRQTVMKRPAGLKPKDLIGLPWRLAFALQADGWWLRSDIIWSKPNPMPESVTDRPTKAHEYVFLLTKSARYFYDQGAVRERSSSLAEHLTRANWYQAHGDGETSRGRGEGHNVLGNPETGRNLRTVWTIPTYAYPGAHFATFPPKLVEPCILAGTSAKGACPSCGAPWERVVEASGGTIGHDWHMRGYDAEVGANQVNRVGGPGYLRRTTGWRPTCYHGDGRKETCLPFWDPIPCHVLDPFCGSGTTGMVARTLGRRFTGIDLSAEYLAMAERRIRCPEPEAFAVVPETQLGLGL